MAGHVEVKWAADLAVSSAPVSLSYFSVERIKIISVLKKSKL